MKTISSEERSTGMGATRFEAVLLSGEWVQVSQMPDVRYEGRSGGIHLYEVDVADDAVTAHFYRSNSGREQVSASNGMSWNSFGSADRWASGKTASTTCPHCGRNMVEVE